MPFFVAEIVGAAKPFRRNDNPEKLGFCAAKSHPNKKKPARFNRQAFIKKKTTSDSEQMLCLLLPSCVRLPSFYMQNQYC